MTGAIKILASTMARILKNCKIELTVFEGKQYLITTFQGQQIYCDKKGREMKAESLGHNVIPFKRFGYPSIATMEDTPINREDLMTEAKALLRELTEAERQEVIAEF